MSHAQFAKRMGVSRPLVTQWCSGVTKITPEKAVEIELETLGQSRVEENCQAVKWSRDRDGKPKSFTVELGG